MGILEVPCGGWRPKTMKTTLFLKVCVKLRTLGSSTVGSLYLDKKFSPKIDHILGEYWNLILRLRTVYLRERGDKTSWIDHRPRIGHYSIEAEYCAKHVVNMTIFFPPSTILFCVIVRSILAEISSRQRTCDTTEYGRKSRGQSVHRWRAIPITRPACSGPHTKHHFKVCSWTDHFWIWVGHLHLKSTVPYKHSNTV